MKIIEDFSEKKVYHHLMEIKSGAVLFVLPDMGSLKHFDPILECFKEKNPHLELVSGLLETLKNRKKQNEYVFINMLNRELLTKYEYIFRMPEIFDYSHYIPEIIGYTNITNIKLDKQFNFILNHFSIGNFIIVNISKNMDIKLCAEYIDFIEANNVSVILTGYSISCAEISNICETNPIIIYGNNVPLMNDLVKKCKFIVGDVKPAFKCLIDYHFIDINEEIELFKSMNLEKKK